MKIKRESEISCSTTSDPIMVVMVYSMLMYVTKLVKLAVLFKGALPHILVAALTWMDSYCSIGCDEQAQDRV